MCLAPRRPHTCFSSQRCFSFCRPAFPDYPLCNIHQLQQGNTALWGRGSKALETSSLFFCCRVTLALISDRFLKMAATWCVIFKKKMWSHCSCAKQPLSALFHFARLPESLKRGDVLRFQLSLLNSEMLTFSWGKMNSCYVGFLSHPGLGRKCAVNSD